MTAPIYQVKADFFKVLGHPARVRVLEVLRDGERAVSELIPAVGLESSHLSQQLGVMRRANLIQARKDGASVVYSVGNPMPLRAPRCGQADPHFVAGGDPRSPRRARGGRGGPSAHPAVTSLSDPRPRIGRSPVVRSEASGQELERVAPHLKGCWRAPPTSGYWAFRTEKTRPRTPAHHDQWRCR